ncbi:MAG: TerB family tellurite resistance protein [Pseudomonadota bacterium]
MGDKKTVWWMEGEGELRKRRIIASFLYLVMPSDGQNHPKELDRFARILADDFNLSERELYDLVQIAQKADPRGHALEQMSTVLKREASREEVLNLLSHMWEMVFADGRMHELEIVFVERVAKLLDIPQDDLVAAMQS